MPELMCPKCQASMRSYERSGVVIDQCTGCRGIFLDAGELEKLMQSEDVHYNQQQQQQQPQQRRGFLGGMFDGDDYGRHGGGHH